MSTARYGAAALNDDPIRALLISLLPGAPMIAPSGMVAILRSRVVEAGGDPEAVRAWVEERGGYVQVRPSTPSRGLRPGRVVARETGPTLYYVVSEKHLA